jgi:thiamine-phosphate pyrophosphorylase
MGEKHSQAKFTQPAVYRILDANLDRAREGLRIVEEWCRFGLNSSQLASQCKDMRQELASWHSSEMRACRDTAADPGTHLTHPQEEQRSSIEHLLQANLCRVEEALRVLEEYSKLYNSKMSAAIEQMRYRVYILESDLLAYKRHQQLLRSHLYLVTSGVEQLFNVVEAALQGGLSIVQYREKTTDDSIKLNYAHKLRQMCRHYNALFIMNDRVDLALAVDADGVHLGQQDIPIGLARQLLGPQKIIGRSTTNPDEMQKAIQEGADYIGVGPVHETPTKAGKAAAGLSYIRHAAENCPIPWFAIGGIDMNNLTEVLKAGAERVAVVRAVMEAQQPTLVTQYFLSQLNRIQALRSIEAQASKNHAQPDR